MDETYNAIQTEELDSLEHYGIKGQKWGLRRYQNPDGSYTELGKERRRVGFEKESKDDDEKSKTSKSESPDIKLGGKAYKDMTRKELKAAKKRARHNEAERRAQREFNAEKRLALEKGDISFISKNISKFTNDEIDQAINRYNKMQNLRNIENANRKDMDYYMNKASNFLNSAEKIVTPITNISNKINEASKKASEKRNQQINEQKNALDLLWKKNPKAKPLTRSEEAELKNKEYLAETQAALRDQNRAKADLAKDEREAKKFQADLIKERLKEERDNEKEIKKEVKEAKKRLAEQMKRRDEADAEWREAALKEELKAKKLQEKEAKKARKEAEKEAERAAKEAKEAAKEYARAAEQEKENQRLYNKAMEELEREIEAREKENQRAYNKKIEDAEKQAETDVYNSRVFNAMSDIYKNDDDNYSWSWFGSSKRGKAAQNKYKDLDSKSIDDITKKYIDRANNNKKESNKEDLERTRKWKKDLAKNDADVIDDWVKDMKKKYMKENKLSAKAAEAKAEAYVDSWLEAYDKKQLLS